MIQDCGWLLALGNDPVDVAEFEQICKSIGAVECDVDDDDDGGELVDLEPGSHTQPQQ